MKKHTLPKLNFSYQDLEPYIDAQTMEVHYTKHHQTYVDNLNAVLAKYPQYADSKLEELMIKLESLKMPEPDKILLRNHGGGHLNHSFFWSILGPKKEINHALVKQIEAQYSTLAGFKNEFSAVAAKHFGSGWAWLVQQPSGEVAIYSTPNQDSPYLKGDKPLIGLDVWEHAYYLKYQSRRPEYIQAFWQVLKLV